MPSGARLMTEEHSGLGSYALPLGRFAEGTLPVEVIEGPILRQAWRRPGAATTLQILVPLRDQIEAAGFTVLLDCKARDCGGFDFRFATEVLPGPGMYVDLTDFRFLSARGAGNAAISVLVSRSSTAAFIQVIRVGDAAEALERTAPPEAGPAPPVPRATGPLAEVLESRGRVVLADLSFATGSSSLGDGDFPSLAALARYLADNPGREVAIVGHTDSVGSLDTNIALSRRRAASVLDRLVSDYGVPRGQLQAGGMGYLAPIVSNLTAEGREANRRVEAVLVSTE
ncbi:MAG: OmpA family protein [Rhodobacteraceae bacterium]|nr:MAG: OmpA family protein [Paracoccaceae bacterium]